MKKDEITIIIDDPIENNKQIDIEKTKNWLKKTFKNRLEKQN